MFGSNQSQRIDTGSAEVDWSSWSEDWPESRDHDVQSQWTDWTGEQMPAADNGWNNHATDKSRTKTPGSRNATAKPAEKNLIDFGFGDEDRSGDKVVTEAAAGDGWDEEVWVDVDDDKWEPLETSPTKSTSKSRGKHD